MIVLVTSFALLVSQAYGATCDASWLHHGDSCYKIESNALKNWPAAKSACESMGAHLAIVMTVDENNFLKSHLRTAGKQGLQWWMDGTDQVTEGTWVWEATGEQFEITDWFPGEPNTNNGEEDCLSFFSVQDYRWNDEHCTYNGGYVCEKELVPIIG